MHALHLVPVLGGKLQQQTAVQNARIVDQSVQRPEPRHCRLDEFRCAVFLTDVPDVGDDPVSVHCLIKIVGNDPCAEGSEMGRVGTS